MLKNDDLPLRPPPDEPKPTSAPAWVALLAAWCGLLMLIASIVEIFLPGSVQNKEELEHLRPYSLADKFLPVPIYGITITLFLGIIVLWQMRKEPRPLPIEMVNQRLQAWVGITLALVATVIIYTWVGLRGPR
ncbi:MAG TPA: hypothetical protein VHD56_13430 [Tepidisphaeraceae bacterium]|nr:hypothetical protein [Tepidisphaeraceae bacterium]